MGWLQASRLKHWQMGASIRLGHVAVAKHLARDREAGIGWLLPEGTDEARLLEDGVGRVNAGGIGADRPIGQLQSDRLRGDPRLRVSQRRGRS